MYYNVYIPGSSKWKNCTRKIIVSYNNMINEDIIKSSTIMHSFFVPDEYQWVYSGKTIDNMSFEVIVEFSNKSKKEIKHLVPEEVDHENRI